MDQFDQFANQGGAAAWDPASTEEAKRVAEEQLRNADYAGDLPEPLGNADGESTGADAASTESPDDTVFTDPDAASTDPDAASTD